MVASRSDRSEKEQRGASGRPDANALAPLLDGLAHGVLIHRALAPLYANRALAARLGFADVDALLAEPSLLPFLPEEDREPALRRYARVLAGEAPAQGRITRQLTRGGASYFTRIDEQVIDWQGAPAIFASLVDVTLEVELRARERYLAEAIDYLSDSFILYGPDDRVLLTNRSFHELFDYLWPQNEIVGRPMEDLVRASVARGVVTDPTLGDDVDGWIRSFIASRRSERLVRNEDSWPGGRFDLVKEQRLRSGGFVSVRTDITDRKRAELAQKDQEARLEQMLAERTGQLQAILANIAQGVVVIDDRLEVVLLNRGFIELYGFPESFAEPGRPLADYIRHRLAGGRYLPFEDRTRSPEAILEERLERYRRMTKEDYQETLASGRVIEVRRQRLPSGLVVSTYSDVTERARTADELRRQREALYQTEKLSALGLLLASIAHELNNPLSVVLGHASILEGGAASEGDRARAGKIRAAADRCARIVKTFLSMARGEPGAHQPLRISDLVERAVDLIQTQLRVSDVQARQEVDPEADRIAGAPEQRTRVLINIFLNARQAKAGQPRERPRVITIATAAEPDWIVIQVSDTGPGVPPAIRRRIFEPFFTTSKEGGGIGLAICHGMVEAHGGGITVEEAPGGGARFVIRLPRAGKALLRTPAAPDNVRHSAPGGRRILVVDDEPGIAAFLADLLAAEGYMVERAASGQEGLARLAETSDVAAIISDLRMPEMDGPTFHAAVAKVFPDLATRFIFTTGDLLSPGSRAFLEEVGQPHLEKPFQPDQVRAMLSRLIAAAEKS
jgi:signal transduction histidine kinase/ActR/RegA family two-component response regulator